MEMSWSSMVFAGRRIDVMITRLMDLQSYVGYMSVKCRGNQGEFEATDFNTASFVVDNIAASSFIKCGLLPVFSSCSMTPTTMSSLTLSVSMRLSSAAPGDGGGVCSYAALPLPFGRSAKETVLVEDEAVEDRCLSGEIGEDVFDVCDRLTFFVGGCWVSVATEDLETEGR